MTASTAAEQIISSLTDTEVKLLALRLAEHLTLKSFPPLMKRRKAAEYLGNISVDTLRSWERRGLVSPVRVPGFSDAMFQRSDLDRFIRGLERGEGA